MGFLAGKKALIVGVASNRSIAWGIANAMHREGAELAFTYQTDKLRPRVEKFAQQLGSEIVLPCDVHSDEQIDAVFKELANFWSGYDILVHSSWSDSNGLRRGMNSKACIWIRSRAKAFLPRTRSVRTASRPWRARVVT